MNADLRKNPFDQEYRSLIGQFSALLKEIVETIDRYGLKRRHLRKFQRRTDQFIELASTQGFSSAASLRYQRRFRRYGGELFTFLKHDGVAWNNNNAENAIKPFAAHRKNVDGNFTAKGIEQYLIFLSIQQTCRFRGVRLLDFLRSGETSLDDF